MAQRRSQNATHRGRRASRASANKRAERVLQKIVTELRHGRSAKAVRTWLEADAHGLFPKGAELGGWLVNAAGKQATTKLIKAWATFSCFYCKKGLEGCERCAGFGSTESRPLCDACLGLGVVRCDCCGGSGWITIHCVPDGLRPAVVVERTALARRGLNNILKNAVPKPTARNPAATLKRCSQQLLAANRLMGIFENTVDALKRFRQSSSMSTRNISKLLKTCVEGGAECEMRIRQIIGCIAASARVEAEAAGADADARRLSLKWAEAYEKLGQSKTYSGTLLEHPFLMQTIRKTIAKAQARAAGKDATSTGKKKRGGTKRR